jgi:hypothetical protein
MDGRHTEPADRVALEVDLDQHHRLLADNPTVVAGIDSHDLRRLVFDDAAIGVLDVDLSAGQEADVSVQAEISADHRLHVDRPSEPWRINHALDARVAGGSYVEPDVPYVAALGTGHRCQKRI